VSDLIDTTEMYLRTIYELEEEGIVPLRARIAERLGRPGLPRAASLAEALASLEEEGNQAPILVAGSLVLAGETLALAASGDARGGRTAGRIG